MPQASGSWFHCDHGERMAKTAPRTLFARSVHLFSDMLVSRIACLERCNDKWPQALALERSSRRARLIKIAEDQIRLGQGSIYQ